MEWFFGQIIDAVPDAVLAVDQTQTIVYANAASEAVFGYTPQDLIGSSLEILIPEVERRGHGALFSGFFDGSESVRRMADRTKPVHARRKDGQVLPVEVSLIKAKNGGSTVVGAVIRDATKWVRQQSELRDQAERDPLTGLYNRRAFEMLATSAVHSAHRSGQPLCVLMGDIDRFKSVNDRFGHATGDKVIRAVADQLSGQSRSSDISCRWGGEEFVILLANSTVAAAKVAAERWRQSIECHQIDAPLPDGPFSVTISIGISTLVGREDDIEALVARADSALYRCKQNGRNRVELTL